MSHIEHCLSEQMNYGNPPSSGGGPELRDMLDDISQYLLNDNVAAASDEKSLMSKVNSLCCLLQDPAVVQNTPITEDYAAGGPDGEKVLKPNNNHEFMHDNRRKTDFKSAEEDKRDLTGGKQAPGMSRKDSFGELLVHLPRIASLPKFLFNISEENSDCSQGK